MRNWQQTIDMIKENMMVFIHTPENRVKSQKDRFNALLEFLDTYNSTTLLNEADVEGNTLLHVALRQWCAIQPNLVNPQNDLTNQFLNVIITKLLRDRANFFMPNRQGETAFKILSNNLITAKLWIDALHISRKASNNQTLTDFNKIDYLVCLDVARKGSAGAFLSNFPSQEKAFEFLYNPIIQVAPSTDYITPMDFLIRAATRYPRKYAMIQALELAYKKFKNPQVAKPVPEEINDTLVVSMIDKTDDSGLAYHRLPSWGHTHSQNTRIFRNQQEKFTELLQYLEGLKELSLNDRKAKIKNFILTFYLLIAGATDQRKILAHEFNYYSQYRLGITLTSSKDCLEKLHEAFISLPMGSSYAYEPSRHDIISDDPEHIFTPDQIEALNKVAQYAGWPENNFNQYEPLMLKN